MRWFGRSPVAPLAVALALGLGSIAWAGHVAPEIYGDDEGEENNPSCASLDPSWNEVKVNQAPNGSYPDSGGGGENPGGDGGLVFKIENSNGKVFDWTSNIGIDAVVVKGGNRGSNVYFYKDEATADQNLRSPDNSQGNTPAVSHVSACYDEDAGDDQGGGQEQPQEQPEEQPQEQPQEDGEEEDGEEDGGGNQRPSEPEQPEDEGGDQPSEPDEPQDDGDGNRRPAEPDEPQEEGDEPGGNQRPAEPEQPDEQDDPDQQTEGEQEEDADGDGEEGEGDVRGISEEEDASDDGASDDVAEEEDADDDLPFTGVPLGALLLVALGLMLAGAAGRTVTRD
jgi:hypothetical protein